MLNSQSSSLVLVGFKHVGKSTIGRALAKKMRRPFVDLDNLIEQKLAGKTIREYVHLVGEARFRLLEHEVLAEIDLNTPSIMAVGGGAVLRSDNQVLLKKHTIVHITAPQGIVYERIMLNGRPAFFSPDEHPLDSFTKLWNFRYPIYEGISHHTFENNESIETICQRIEERFIL